MFGTKQKKKKRKEKSNFAPRLIVKGKKMKRKMCLFFFSFMPTWRLIYNLGQKCKFHVKKRY